jgi:Holliday junction DNA helicase RuvB
LAEIIHRSAGILGVTVTDEAAALMAACARGTPRVANRLLRRMRDFAQMGGGTTDGKADAPAVTVTPAVVQEGLRRLEIDALGLEKYDREILLSIIENFGGGPVGAETLASSIGEAVDTLEDYYEPFLIQCGLLQRTGRGRMVTEKAYAHLGVEPSSGGRDSTGGQRLLF